MAENNPILGMLETSVRDMRLPDSLSIELSVAISLKRIADALSNLHNLGVDLAEPISRAISDGIFNGTRR